MQATSAGNLFLGIQRRPAVFMVYTLTRLLSDMLTRMPLMEAATKGDIQTLTKLAGKGNLSNDRDDEGRTPLYWCAARGDVAGCNVLLMHGAAVNATTMWGATPLHSAAEGSHARCAELLIKEGANVNCRNSTGDTPLHHACYYGDHETVQVLLKFGASLRIRNDQGRTPLDEAKSNHHDKLLRLLASSDGKSATNDLHKPCLNLKPNISQKIDPVATGDLGINGYNNGDTETCGASSLGANSKNSENKIMGHFSFPPGGHVKSQSWLYPRNLPDKVRSKVDSTNGGLRRTGSCKAQFFVVQNQQVAVMHPDTKADSASLRLCPNCGYAFRANAKMCDDDGKSGDVTRIRQEYRVLSRMFGDLQLELNREREENDRLHRAMARHNNCFHHGGCNDLPT